MNDKELLELAAKAAGIEMTDPDEKHCSPDWDHDWNPLTDDGDALRLAVKLRIDFEYDDDKVVAWFLAPRPGWDNGQVWAWTEPLGNDPYAATRRAIVRTAAEIGKEME